MGDFLWDCEFAGESVARQSDENVGAAGISALQTVFASHSANQEQCIVSTVETRGDGVLDDVGSELWEASLLLCSYILHHWTRFKRRNALELGCGVALAGLLYAQLHLLSCESTEVSLSDFDGGLLGCLDVSIQRQFSVQSGADSETDAGGESARVALHTMLLDWREFSHGDDDELGADLHRRLAACSANHSRFGLVLGSALCYTADHACLADLVRSVVFTIVFALSSDLCAGTTSLATSARK